MNKYQYNLRNTTKELDMLLSAEGNIFQFAVDVIENNNDKSAFKLIKKIAQITESYDNNLPVLKATESCRKALLEHYGHKSISDICRQYGSRDTDARNLTDLLADLNKLIGLDNVKSKVNDLIVYQQVQKLRREHNLITKKNTMHMAFLGNPGTGKTTVARIVGHIYRNLGLLSKGHFIEVSRTDLIAGYQGQTALKVKKVIEEAKGGVLFIDEAYSITENEHSDSYGRECLTELTKALEDYRDDLVVIVAGYTEPMNKFFDSNPGLKSRFNIFLEFSDYDADELLSILEGYCADNNYKLSDNLKQKLYSFFKNKTASKSCNFENGRLARNVFDDLVMNHAKRVIKKNHIMESDLIVIEECDFIEPLLR